MTRGRRRLPGAEEELAAWVAKSRRAQGFPPTVQDPATLAKVAELLAAPRPEDAGGGPPGPAARRRPQPVTAAEQSRDADGAV